MGNIPCLIPKDLKAINTAPRSIIFIIPEFQVCPVFWWSGSLLWVVILSCNTTKVSRFRLGFRQSSLEVHWFDFVWLFWRFNASLFPDSVFCFVCFVRSVWPSSRSNFVLKFWQVVGLFLFEVVSKFRRVSNCFGLSFCRDSARLFVLFDFAGCLSLVFVRVLQVVFVSFCCSLIMSMSCFAMSE